ncbi:hypothetical protein DEO72_LG2g3818 [Vigna unguiculata]|uniref:Uncharacterized protein n=1 Tax=Vigna unguiculata TaxID=3917 RepID=A0A4D6L4X5_VIGUN|nr:hypothetical protein DEO72_LG2g3818 [Vigna unguiculata]
MSESRPLRNDDPFSSSHYLYPGSEGRSLAMEESVKVSSYTNGFRNSNAARSHYYRPNRASPGGPDPHHHFKTGSNTLN